MSTITSSIAMASLAVAILAPGSVSGRPAEPVIGYAYTLNNDGDPKGVPQPLCTETVDWLLLTDPMEVSQADVTRFAKLTGLMHTPCRYPTDDLCCNQTDIR